ncbi:MAG: Crp/Fnr family transcriptional regulator [Proteobacteria bacterium]|nr:MAG: Crp/Fnr family transcriptional regulator [Pseudomonadota bacterium]
MKFALLEHLGFYLDNLSLAEDDISYLVSRFAVEEYAPGDEVVQQAAGAQRYRFIEKGLFRSFIRNEEKQEYIHGFFHEGRLLGPFSATMNSHSPDLQVQALERSIVYSIKASDLHDVLGRAGILEQFTRVVAERAFVESDQRLYQLLTQDASKRYENFLLSHQHLRGRIHQYMIAMYLGISPVSLSRIVKKMDKSFDTKLSGKV